jgi:uracil-DNA glycosylase
MWTERQAALLKAMGVRLWSPRIEAASAPPPAAPAAAAPDVARAADWRVAGPAPAAPSVPAAPPAAAHGGLAPQLATLDWSALRRAVADCRACSLCESRRQTVFGAGHPRARWLVVGEAPGEQEDAAGEPFVGPAGQLLDAMLQALQLSRRADDDLAAWPAAQRVYIANTLKCRPPRNRNPEPEELAQCAPFLARQVQLLQPRVILALGRFAVYSLLGSTEAIGRLRGRVHRHQGIPVIVSYHPAYLLRNPADKARAWDDLCLAAETAEATVATETAAAHPS